jgi:hypothetical protein
MFVEAEGPTALRPEMIRALAFSVTDRQVETSNGIERCTAALAAVWNGREGFVAVLLRSLDRPEVRRYVHPDPIHSLSEVHERIEEGVAFALSLGFELDGAEFRALGEEVQKTRLLRWNKLRKPRSGPRQLVTPPQPDSENADTGPAVLGRITLVRHGDDRPGLLAQLLSFF